MVSKDALRSLEKLLHKGQVFTDVASLLAYEVDAGLDYGLPDGVVLPHSAHDLALVARWAAEHRVPLVGRGAGTGLSGGAVAEQGGLIVEFSRMNRVLEIDVDGRSALVEPGLINLRLDEQVREHDLYFPPDPASQRASTIGGNVSENSGGPHCFKYGVTSNYVTGMEVVLADGRIVQVGGRAFDYPAYDLCGLLVGSEGMLALMTAISVRLVRNPPAIKTMLAVFDSVEQAGVAVSAVIAAGLVPATMEMMDKQIIRIVEEYVHGGLPTEAEAMLIIEVDGNAESLDAQSEEMARILRANGGYNLRIANSAEERNQIWFARKSAAGALARLAPAHYTVDITVPRSRLAEALVEVNQICERYNLRVGYVFHAGDGNLHPLILIPDPQDAAFMERVHSAGGEIVEVAIRKDGSLSGEHGVGIEKRAFMPLMFNEAELSAMLDVKQVFDPQNLLNPGKIFPSTHNETGGGALFMAPSPKNLPQSEGAINRAPTSAKEAAQLLVECAQAGQSVHITGTDVGARFIAPSDVTLCTSGLRGINTYAPDDLYITVGAGTPLAEIQSFLAQHNSQVPLASPWPDATIGGLVASNMNAPMRMRYGAIRDLVLCATVVLADGRVLRVGRPVMKNVAGFDLTKLFTGSYGTLGLITDVTLKIVGKPRAQRTLFIPVDDLRYGLLWARRLLPMSLMASAIVVCNGEMFFQGDREGREGRTFHSVESLSQGDREGRPYNTTEIPSSLYMLMYTAEGTVEDVEAELAQVRALLRKAGGAEPIVVEGVSGTDVWVDALGQAGDKVQMRVGVPIKELPVYMQDASVVLNAGAFMADFGSGFVYTVLPSNDEDAVRAAVEQLRGPALRAGGYAIVTHLPDGWQGGLDRWGYAPDTLDIMRGLKARWDPHGILNPREFVV